MVLIFNTKVDAQVICKTSTTPNIGTLCQNNIYDPVCGCDTVTYRHPCDAVLIHNVQYYQTGICNQFPFALDVFPIPFSQAEPLKLAIQTRANTTSAFTIYIWDAYGILQLYRNIGQVSRYDWLIESYNFKPGVYIIAVISSSTGYSERRKVIVTSQ